MNLKVKLIQVFLGAIGSAVTILVQHLAAGSADPAVAIAAGAATSGLFGDAVVNLV